MKNAHSDKFLRGLSQSGLWIQATLGFAFLYLPILILVIYSFNASRFNAVWSGFTLDWYRSLFGQTTEIKTNFANAEIWQAWQNSLLIATIVTVLSVVLGTAIALALERYRFPGYRILENLLFLPMIIPEISLGLSLLVFFTLIFRILENLTGIRLTLGFPSVIIGHVTFNISFVTVTVRARLADLDPALEEAAFDLGANEWRTFWLITFPLILPGVISAALLAFTLSLDDFVVTFFTTGVGTTTLPLFVYGMIKFSVTPAINAISTLMLFASVLLVVSSLTIKGNVKD